MKVMTIANVKTIDSREVAQMVDMRHADLIRNIESYIATISENAKLRSQDYFILDTYKADGNNKTYKCYRLTKMGCEMVANKLTGKKGILFTAEYVKRFNDMEQGTTPTPPAIDDAKQMRAEAMNINARTRASKVLLNLAELTDMPMYKNILVAKAANIVTGENTLPLPKTEDTRKTYTVEQLCAKIGKPKSWRGQLGKVLKKNGMEQVADNGFFTHDSVQGHECRIFNWYEDVILPKLAELFPSEYTAM